MPAVMSVLHAAAVNVYSTAISLTVRRKQTWTLSKRRCSISSVHSMWQEDVRTVASAAEYQAGEDTTSKGPLTNFTFEDVEPSIVAERG